jgi:hypothetical protein
MAKPTEVLIPDAAVQAIQESVKTAVIKIDDKEYVTREVFDPPEDSVPVALKLHTLTGLVDFINFEAEGFGHGVAVHVENHDKVNVVSAVFGRAEQRATYAAASSENILGRGFQFGTFMDCEAFIISLQSLFVQTPELSDVLRVVGNIKEENVRTTGDDGVTQTVTARAGIARVAELEVPNPVELQPFRTFREVEQPSSTFILRMRQGKEGSLPTCALFEADGGKWKLDAVESVKAFLAERLSGTPIIA